MRKFALSLICLSALAVGCTPPAAPPATPAKSTPGTPAGSGTTSQVTPVESNQEKTTLVALRVPTMSCPFSCWPSVKETLEGQGGVASVELAKQEADDVINNPVVYVRLAGAFDQKAAVAALDKAGFTGTEFVKN
jgi:periplasmic mercuric ion binding protein